MSSELMDALKALAREKNIDEYQMLDKLEQSLAGTYQRILDLDNNVRVDDRPRERPHLRLRTRSRRRDRRGDRRGRVLRGARRHARRRLAHRRPERKERHRLDHPRGRARADLRRVRRPDRRVGHRHRAAERQPIHPHQAAGRRRGAPAAERAAGQRALRPQPADQGLHHRRAQDEQRALDRRVAHAPRPSSGASSRSRCPRSTTASSRSRASLASRACAPRSPFRAASPGLDPVGACVGPKGSRVRMIVERASRRAHRRRAVVRGALRRTSRTRCRPPRSTARSSTSETHTATVIVPDDQLSLAIGKEGQNARLAAKLTGWRIDIKSASSRQQGLYTPASPQRRRARPRQRRGVRRARQCAARPPPGSAAATGAKSRQLLLCASRQGGGQVE